MITAEIVLDARYKSKKGYPVKIRIYDGISNYKYIPLNIYQTKTKLQRTSEIIERENQLIKEINYVNKNYISFDESINIFKSGAPSENVELEIMILKKKIAELEKLGSMGVLEFFDIRIEELKSIKRPVKVYEDARKQFEKFIQPESDFRINDIDYEWLNKFIQTKKAEGTKNAINTYLRTLRAIYKEAQRRKSISIKSDNPFLGIIKNIDNKNIPPDISSEMLKNILNYKPHKFVSFKSKEIIQRNIDLFIFQFAIGGHDFVDLATLEWSNIKNGRIVFKRFKNRNKPNGGIIIDNKLNPFALSIIEKYGRKNSKRIFSFIPDPTDEEEYFAYRQIIYRSLSRISKNLKFQDNIKTKTPRYLFRTFAGNLFIDSYAIMQIQGHKPEGVSFGYQRRLPNETIDAEMEKVLKLIF